LSLVPLLNISISLCEVRFHDFLPAITVNGAIALDSPALPASEHVVVACFESRLSIFFIFGGLGMLITVFVLNIPDFNLKSTSDALKILFFLHPGFAFSQVS
jgi:hypothetical protein